MSLLYCVCRRLDDAIDEAPDLDHARAALSGWHAELAGRAPARPLVAAFLAGVPRTGLPLSCAEHLLDGMELDLGAVRIADDDALLRYAYRVSAAVGLMLAPLLGVRGEQAEQRVVDLGLALQLSNILLGVAGDARRDRVYLPASRLAAAGLTADDVLAAPGDPRLRPVLEGIAELADHYYRSAALGAAFVPLRYRHGVILLGRAYAELGRRAARGLASPDAPAQLPHAVKALRLFELFATAWHPRTLGFVAAPPHDPALHRALPGWRGAHVGARVTAIVQRAAANAGTVATSMVFRAAPAAVWERLMFYEQIDQRPPLHLRLLLPVPIETNGHKSEVGDEARCIYEGGYLIKRVTEVEPQRRYAFEVVEQALTVGGGMRLSGGEYLIRELERGRAEVRIVTRYASPKRPRWLWRPIEQRGVSLVPPPHPARDAPRGRGAVVIALLPPVWLVRVAVAAVWLYEGLWCKLLGGDPQPADVVEAVPRLGPQVGALFLQALGVVEVAIGVWVLSGFAPVRARSRRPRCSSRSTPTASCGRATSSTIRPAWS